MPKAAFQRFAQVILPLAAIVTVSTTAVNPVVAQRRPGLYVLHTRPQGTCPGLDWHVTVEPDSSLVGYVAWDKMQHMARLQGSIEKDGDFQMNAQEVGGAARHAVVKGRAAGDYITMTITESSTGCENQTFQVPRFEGGLSGGGG